MSEASAIKWLQRYERVGEQCHAGTGGHRPSKVKPVRDWLLAAIAAEPDITLAALAARLLAEQGVRVDTGMLSRFSLVRASASKKRAAQRAGSTGTWRADARWKHYQGRIDPRRLVFIDETWAKTNMLRTHGRCRRGERLHAKAPHGHWKTRPSWQRSAMTVSTPRPSSMVRSTGVTLSSLCRTAPGADAQARRCRHSRQSGQPQRPGDPHGDPSCRRKTALLAALRPRPKPHRAGLRQAQDAAPKGRRDLSKQHGDGSAPCSITSLQANAPTTLQTLDMHQSNRRTLWGYTGGGWDFEPTIGVTLCTLSKRVPSTTRPSLQTRAKAGYCGANLAEPAPKATFLQDAKTAESPMLSS